MAGTERGWFSVDFVPEPEIMAQGFFMAADRLNNMIEPLKEIAEFVSEELDKNFDRGQGRWAPLKESTLRKKGGTRILEDSGDLRGEQGDPSRWSYSQGGTITVATWMPGDTYKDYGHFHISSTKFMPARDFMSLDAVSGQLSDFANDTFGKWVQGVMSEI